MQKTITERAGAAPVELTRFIGRERELAALRELAAESRLLTLTGTGGSGKSRLALALVPLLEPLAPDGSSWVELAPIQDEALVPGAALRALDPAAEPGAGATERLIDQLRDRTSLLVLDNCEHVVDECAVLAEALLRACPGVRILATSREALGVPGERAWLVPPLCLPAPDASPEQLASCDAVRLFVDRARDVVADFRITAQNAAAVAAICARLEGIPLAIELAAARVRVMTPEQIAGRLDDAFALLTSTSRTALPRHRTLRATIDWSHDLLPDDARAVLRRLAVFRGGFTLDAAEAVAAGDDIAAAQVLDIIAALLDRSLLLMREQDGAARYHLLETMRQYATQRLQHAGEEAAALRALAGYVAQLVAAAEPEFTTPRRRAAFARLDPELDNIRTVLHWTREHDPAAHVRLVGMLWWYWFSTRHWLEAREWIVGALALPAGAQRTHERAALLFSGGALAALQAQVPAARAQLTECIELTAELQDARLQAYAHNYLAMTWAQVGGVEGRDYAARAEAWFRAHDEPYGLRLALLLMGMGEVAAGNVPAARLRMEEATEIARGFGQDRELGVALQTYAGILLDAGDTAGAEARLIESLRALQRDWSYLFVGRALDMLAIAMSGRDPADAARRIGAGDALRGHVGADRFHLDQQRIDAARVQLTAALGAAEFERLYADGHARAHEVVAAAVAAPAAGEPAAAAPAAATAAVATAAAAAATTAATTDAVSVTVAVFENGDSAPPADLRVRLFGGLRVWVHGRAAEWAYAKPKELLAFLLAHPRGRTRVEIGAAIWPDATPAQLRNNFHVTLHHLRKALGHADWVVLDGDRYRFAPTVSVEADTAVFEREIRRVLGRPTDDASRDDDAARLTAALSLYTDHYLRGEVAGRWRDEEQDRLRRLYCEAALRLGALLDQAGDAAGAVRVYEAIVAHDPLLEEAHRRLIVHWSRAGDRVRAIRHYERLAAVLNDELQLEPDPETAELYEQLKAQ